MDESTRVEIRLQPRGSRDELLGWRDGVLRAKVSASPVEGKANQALCRLIAKRAGVPPSRVSIVRGERSRDKVVQVEGVDDATLCTALGG